jgi:hypothetical protein
VRINASLQPTSQLIPCTYRTFHTALARQAARGMHARRTRMKPGAGAQLLPADPRAR